MSLWGLARSVSSSAANNRRIPVSWTRVATRSREHLLTTTLFHEREHQDRCGGLGCELAPIDSIAALFLEAGLRNRANQLTVCTLPLLSVAGIRCTRCAPDSKLKVCVSYASLRYNDGRGKEKNYSPQTLIHTHLALLGYTGSSVSAWSSLRIQAVTSRQVR